MPKAPLSPAVPERAHAKKAYAADIAQQLND